MMILTTTFAAFLAEGQGALFILEKEMLALGNSSVNELS